MEGEGRLERKECGFTAREETRGQRSQPLVRLPARAYVKQLVTRGVNTIVNPICMRSISRSKPLLFASKKVSDCFHTRGHCSPLLASSAQSASSQSRSNLLGRGLIFQFYTFAPAVCYHRDMSNLHSFLQSSKPQPQAVCTSQEIRDRGSIFVANIFRATGEDEARKTVSHLRNVIHGQRRATHEMFAWRCMVLKSGKTGLGGPDDFELKYGNEDDGEKYGSGKIAKVMQTEGIIDAVVVVSRW
jgi:hypothetical protein